MRSCAFALPGGTLCAQPALKRSREGLCRFHAGGPLRAQNARRAQAVQALLPQRRLCRSEAEFLLRRKAAFRIPALDSIAALNQTLAIVMQQYDGGVFDLRTTRAMLGCLRVAYRALRRPAGHAADAAQRADFYAHYRACLARLQQERAVKGGPMHAAGLPGRA